ncbi:MAG: YdcF family protein [bacterium]|nr:YdcF family protein [bacterium]
MIRGFFLALGGIVFLGIFGFALFVVDMVQAPQDTSTKTDGIVVLTGGSERIKKGLLLLHKGLAPQLFISGVHKGVRRTDILRKVSWEVPQNTVTLGYQALDTQGNALEINQWCQKTGVQTVRLVTSNYHMRRSLQELRHILETSKDVIAHPVKPSAWNKNPWWKKQSGWELVFGEYIKYLAVLARSYTPLGRFV